MNLDTFFTNSERIPLLSDTAIRLQELLQDDRSTIDDIAEVISIDPSLTSKLLRMANSAFYNFPTSIESAGKAVSVLGTKAVYNLALASSALEAMSQLNSDSIDLQRFWQQSIDTALIARELARRISVAYSERLFVCGLLANLGELICADRYPEKAKEASPEVVKSRKLPWETQQEVFGFTYAKLTQALMTIWQLPITISEPVGNIFSPENSHYQNEARILRIAVMSAVSQIINEIAGDENAAELVDPITEDDLAVVGLDRASLNDAIEYANFESINILSILSPGGSSIF